MGVDLRSFWALNPHSLQLIADGYNIAYKRQIEANNAIAYLQGQYFVEALLCTVGNMFSDKRNNKHKYPEKPYDLNLDGNKEERNKEDQIKLFASNLDMMMTNFNLSKEQG